MRVAAISGDPRADLLPAPPPAPRPTHCSHRCYTVPQTQRPAVRRAPRPPPPAPRKEAREQSTSRASVSNFLGYTELGAPPRKLRPLPPNRTQGAVSEEAPPTPRPEAALGAEPRARAP